MSGLARLGLVLLALAGTVEAADDGAIGEIRQRGYLKVCADPSNPPFSSTEPASPGFEVELARRIAAELGVEARFAWNLTYVRALRPLRDGRCDLFMGLPADERFRDGNPWIAVSRPYYVMGHAIVTRAGVPLRSLADLAGTRVAIEGASIADLFVAERAPGRGIHRTQREAFEAVVNGESPAALLWLPVARWLARGRGDIAVLAVHEPRLEYAIGAGVRRRDGGLPAAVDAAIGRLAAAGAVRDVLRRYGATAEPEAAAKPPETPASPAASGVALAQAGAAGPGAEHSAVEHGRSLFSTACSRCHGAEGVGGGTGGAIPSIRKYDGGWDKFLRIVKTGRKNTAMAPFRGILTDNEIRSIFEYLTSLR